MVSDVQKILLYKVQSLPSPKLMKWPCGLCTWDQSEILKAFQGSGYAIHVLSGGLWFDDYSAIWLNYWWRRFWICRLEFLGQWKGFQELPVRVCIVAQYMGSVGWENTGDVSTHPHPQDGVPYCLQCCLNPLLPYHPSMSYSKVRTSAPFETMSGSEDTS